MPVTLIKKRRLLKLLGIEASDKDLLEVLSKTKVEAEFIDPETLEVEVTPDRLDLLVSEGLARELRGLLGLEKGYPKYRVSDTDIELVVYSNVKPVRPFIAVAVIKGYYVDQDSLDEIIQFQEKLHTTLGRDRRKIAIGFYDLDKLNSRKIIYRAEKPDKIRYVPLGETREMSGREIVEKTEKGRKYRHLIDGYGAYPLLHTVKGQVLSIPTILNSEDTKVDVGTKNLFIDVTGTDKYLVNKTLDLIVTTLSEVASEIGKVLVIDVGETYKTPVLTSTELVVETDYLKSIIGLDVGDLEIAELLERMRYHVEPVADGKLYVKAPPYRLDILHKVDVAEDVAIAYGYNELIPELPKTFTVGRELVKTKFLRKIREIMTGLGFQEVLTFTLASKKLITELVNAESSRQVEILNPISPLYNTIRSTLIANMVQFLKQNQHSDHPIKVFEVGDTVEVHNGEAVVKTKLAASILSYKVGFEDIQATLYALAKTLGLTVFLVEEKTPPKIFLRGRTAKININGKLRGIIGELDPQYLLEKLEIEYPVALFEIDISNMWNEIREKK